MDPASFRVKDLNDIVILDLSDEQSEVASWGNPSGQPILLVHGRQDSLSTFIPLLEYLPDSYYYVALDLPGNGKSDPFPTGIILSRFLFIVAVDYVVNHLKWKNFGYISHSMGSSQGLTYNAINPGKITKMVLIDPLPSLYFDFSTDMERYHKLLYKEYYDNYEKYNIDTRVYSKEQAVGAVMKARHLSRAQAEVVLDRNLKPVGEDSYKLSWDRRFRVLVPSICTPEFYFKLISKNQPPTLVLHASNNFPINEKNYCTDLVNQLERDSPDFFVEVVDGRHDVHITNAVDVSVHVNRFLEKQFLRAKL